MQNHVEVNLLLEILRKPERICDLDLSEWDQGLRQARNTRLLPRLAVVLAENALLEKVPDRVKGHLTGACAIAGQHQRIIRWEVNRIERALVATGIPIVLLKGAAYAMAGLPPARGRLSCDVDILVPKDRLSEVESALRQNGWEGVDLDPYDERYYRLWMHELPPLRHRDRHTTIDVHHTLLPESGRLHPDSAELIRSAHPLPGTGVFILAPTDMVLHSAAHLFQDGDLAGGLRDLIDLDDLFRYFGRESGFWSQIVPRAQKMDLARPLFYALRYTQQILETPVPPEVIAGASAGAPPRAILPVMDYLVRRALIPYPPETAPAGVGRARWVLYVRSHWLRMPPILLTRHLTRKAFRQWIERWKKRREKQDVQHARDEP